jgi:hypothetical protein
MRPAPAGFEASFGVAVTDIFICASAALLVALALSRNTPEVPVPIQADIVATCPPADAVEAGGARLALRAPKGAATPVPVGSPADLAAAPDALGLPPRLYYTLAVTAGEGAPLSAACLRWVQDGLVRRYNARVGTLTARGAPRPVFGVAPVTADAGRG